MKNFYSIRVFWLLFLTFNISLSYEWIYRTLIVNYSSKYDSFGLENIPFYLIGFGLAFLTLINKTWSWWIIFIGIVAYLFIGIFIYVPNILPNLQPGIIDYSELAIFLLFLAWAGSFCLRRLFFNKE